MNGKERSMWRLLPGLMASVLALVPLATPVTPAHAAAQAGTGVVFPGPLRGTPAARAPRAGDFVTNCNASINSSDGKVGGATIPAGTAIAASTGCGVATLMLDAPGAGRFQATYGVSDADTTGSPALLRVRVIGRDGGNLRLTQYAATRGHTIALDVDVSKATALVLNFLSGPDTFVYNLRLSGTARVLTPARLPANPLPAGATPVNMAGAAYSCNASQASATAPLTVTLVGLPTTGSFKATDCGQVALSNVPSKGTLVLRYGLDDQSTSGSMLLSVRVLDAKGHLLRKAVGAPFIGSGLQQLWVDLSGAHSVTLAASGSPSSTLDATAVGVLPRRFPVYKLPDRTISGGAPTGTAIVDPRAFVSTCNSSVGTDDVTVGHQLVFGGTYLSTYDCGQTSLIFCCTNARGSFHALFGAPDSDSGHNKAPVATVVIKDKNNKVLRQLTVHASFAARGVPIDISVNGASVLAISFRGDSGILFNMSLSGIATISQLIYAPTEPPVAVPGGVAVSPYDLTLSCNAEVATSDVRLVGATTLEGWALSGTDCGQATLNLRGGKYPRHQFYARVGIAVGQPPDTVTTIRVGVLGAGGKVLRAQNVVVRYGFGTLPFQANLAGATAVQLSWTHVHDLSAVVVYDVTTK